MHVVRFGLHLILPPLKGSQTCDHGEARAGLERTREGGGERAVVNDDDEYSLATETRLAALPSKKIGNTT